ncbi:MAG TPA: fumarylacetoacetate hydrolase family protein [Rhodocyclaceae bacterium]|nr:fumarylacetoacetate hydrolase family protein [Rhodocyclaceae bacterium]
MSCWLRFEADGAERFGTLTGTTIAEYADDMFGAHRETGRRFELAAVRLLTPTRAGKMIGLWNNFHERARAENLQQPAHPLYFLKAATSFAAHGEPIRRPAGYAGRVVFEGELGIVIGRRCANVSAMEAPDVIFGYTCVNDVTARDILRADPSFPQWTRAKSFDTFGVFGPCVVTGLDPLQLRVRAIVAGVERQNYPVADMFFPPAEIVSRLSQDMTLEPGDVIACGTSVGAGEMQDGDSVAIAIEGIGVLENRFS